MNFLLYFLSLTLSTLGVFFLCGLTVHLISRLFARLLGSGSGKVFDLTSVIGTPIHELGHAAMCKLFCHEITAIRLWNPRPEKGVYGFVEHSYSKRNLWARLGNLFIGMGPLFSGLGVTVLTLWLCMPSLWSDYLAHSSALAVTDPLPFAELIEGVFLLIGGLPKTVAADPLRTILGLVIVLPVSLHISMSPQDLKGSLSSLPIVIGILAILSLATFWTPARTPILSGLMLFDLRLLSLFALVIAFSLVWLILAALLRGIKLLIRCF